MAQFNLKSHAIVGTGGSLPVPRDDEVTRKLSMLIEGECEGLGPLKAAGKFGFSKQRYFQLRAAFAELGAAALQEPANAAPRPTTGAPPRWSARSSATASSTPMPPPR